MAIPKITSYAMPLFDRFPKNRVNWTFDPKRAVLLVHDMQRYFLNFYAAKAPIIAALIANIRQLTEFARTQGMRVVYTAQPIEQTASDRALLLDMWGRGIDNFPALKDITPEIAPADGDIVLPKWRYSAFIRSHLADQMTSWGCDQLVICGVYAHIGCMQTAAHAFQLDIKPFLVGNAVADFSLDEHLMALTYTATCCGMVTTVKELMQR